MKPQKRYPKGEEPDQAELTEAVIAELGKELDELMKQKAKTDPALKKALQEKAKELKKEKEAKVKKMDLKRGHKIEARTGMAAGLPFVQSTNSI